MCRPAATPRFSNLILLSFAAPGFLRMGIIIFYRKAADATQTVFRVYRMPVLGGTPQVLVSDVDYGPTFSPDGKRMAYVRANDPEAGKYRLLSSNLDGSDEKILQIAPLPGPDNLSWSPDGKRIAFISYSQSNAQGQISIFEIASSKDTPLTSFPDKVFSDLAWTPDGRGLLVNYRSSGATNQQIGFVSYPARPLPIANQRHSRLSNAEPFWRRQSNGLDSAARNGFSLLAARDGQGAACGSSGTPQSSRSSGRGLGQPGRLDRHDDDFDPANVA